MIFSIENASQDRRNDQNSQDATEIILRIAAAYRKAKITQDNVSSVYNVSDVWLPIYSQFITEIINALSNNDVSNIKKIYNNFFRDRCSSGLHGFLLDVPRHFSGDNIHPEHRELYFKDTLHRFNLWWELMEMNCPVDELKTPDIGNPYGFTVDGVFIRAGADYHHYYATIISRLIRSKIHRSVAEIGGGFGGMAYFLLRDNSNLCYMNFDLPENLALASFYLLSAFPEKRIALYGEIDVGNANLEDYDAVLLPSFEIGNVRDNSIDLSFNSYSLAEMSKETVDDYVVHMNRFTSKFIFHVNHNKIGTVKASELGVSKDKFELVYRAMALWNLVRDSKMDEFEFLYKRQSMSFSLEL